MALDWDRLDNRSGNAPPARPSGVRTTRTLRRFSLELRPRLYRALGAAKLRRAFGGALKHVFRTQVVWLAVTVFVGAPAFGWDYWGGDPGGMRFSPLAQITPANVGNLVRAWAYHTGDLDKRAPALMARTKFEATPLFVEDGLIFCSPFNEVIALDPGTGAEK